MRGRRKYMFARKLRYLQAIGISILLATLAAIGIIVLTLPNEGERVAEGDRFAHAADEYATAAQTDYDALTTQACATCGKDAYVIDSPLKMAAVMKYGGAAVYLNRCYAVTYPGVIDFTVWTENGVRIYPGLGTEDAAYAGHFDFGGCSIKCDYNGGGTESLFRWADRAVICNLNLVHSGTGYALGLHLANCEISGVNLQCVATEGTATSGLFIYSNGTSEGTGSQISNCTVNLESAATLVTFTKFGGVASYNYGTVRDCTVIYGAGNMNMTGFGGVCYYNYAGSEIRDCKIVFAEGGNKYNTARDHWGGIAGVMEADGNATVISGCSVQVSLMNSVLKVYNGFGTGGILGGVPYSGDVQKTVSILNCKVTGGGLCGASNIGGILGAYYANVSVTNCFVNLSMIGGQFDAGGICGSDLLSSGLNMSEYPLLPKFTITIKDCNSYIGLSTVSGAHGALMGAIRCMNGSLLNNYAVLEETQTATQVGGILGHTWMNVLSDGCVLSVDGGCYGIGIMSASGGAKYCGGFIGQKIKTYGKVEIRNAANFSPFAQEFGTGSTLNGIDSPDNVTLTEETEKTDWINKIKDSVDAGTTVADITGKSTVTQKSVTIEVAFSGSLASDYEVQSLYISVVGEGVKGYTQIIHKGKALASIGANYVIGDSVDCSVPITYAYATEAEVSSGDVYVKLWLKHKTTQNLKYYVMRNGILI